MLNWYDIQVQIVNALRATPDVVVTVGGVATRIYAYEDKFPGEDIFTAISKMTAPSIMVAWGGNTVGSGQDDARPWRHQFWIIKVPNGHVGLMDKAISNGIVTGPGVRFIDYSFGLAIDPAEEISHDRQTIDYLDSVLQYYRTLVTYTEHFNADA